MTCSDLGERAGVAAVAEVFESFLASSRAPFNEVPCIPSGCAKGALAHMALPSLQDLPQDKELNLK